MIRRSCRRLLPHKGMTRRPGPSQPGRRIFKKRALTGEREPSGCGVAKRRCICERAELAQALVLDLPDALAGDVQCSPHLLERAWVLAVQPEAEFQHLTLAAREGAQDPPEGLLAHPDLGLLVGQRHVLVGEEVAELRLLLVTDRLLQRDRGLRAAADPLDLLRR